MCQKIFESLQFFANLCKPAAQFWQHFGAVAAGAVAAAPETDLGARGMSVDWK